ncbi:hypothetical protein [Nitrospira sp. Nam74]
MALRRFVCCLLILLVSGCAFSRPPSQTVRTATEQLLLSQAIERSLHDLSLPLAEGSTVMIETAGFAVPPTAFIPSDLNYARDTVAGRLGQLGLRIHPKNEEPEYIVRVLVQSLGTVQGETFIGIPSVAVLGFALPELTLYKAQFQSGYMRYSIDVYESATGRFIRSTPWYTGSSYYDQYTVLFLFRYNTTDLILPP